MPNDDELWALEERFWTGGADSARALTAEGAVVVVPYPAGILQGDALWSAQTVDQRWRSVVFSDRLLSRKADIAVLAYRVSAEKEGTPAYEALCASTCLNDGGDCFGCRTSRPRFDGADAWVEPPSRDGLSVGLS